MIIGIFGKGGVGKTTISSALALEYKEIYDKVAIITTDPMPSLNYIFKEKVEGIDLIEYSEEDASREWIKKYGDEVYDLITSFFDIDREIIEHIARAPGIPEEFILSVIFDYYDRYDMIIWDTAAASSTMNLLKAEYEFYDHIGRDIKFYLSIKSVLDKLNRKNKDPLEILNRWKELAKNIMDLLSKKGSYYIIENDDEISRKQGEIIEKELRKMNMNVRAHVRNRSKENSEFSIPEFTGNPREIVEKSRSYVRKIFQINKF